MNDVAPTPLTSERFRKESISEAAGMLRFTAFALILAGSAWAGFHWKNGEGRVDFAYSLLLGFFYCYTISAGGLFWVLLHHAVDADWTVVVRRIFEHLATMLWLVVPMIALIVFLFGHDLYHWLSLDPAEDILLGEKSWYLNKPFYIGRMIFYVAYFLTVSCLMKRFSVDQDRTGDANNNLKARKLAYASILLFALCLTFSSVDYLMALDYKWYSTMWGVYIFAGSALSSMAFAILIANALKALGYLKGVFNEEHNHIMGKLMFSFVVFWGYIAFSQFFLIYYSNIPEETWFFTYRNMNGWNTMAKFIVYGHFALPFLWLITQPAKKNPIRICLAAGWILMMHFFDLFWLIIPQKAVNQLPLADKYHPDHLLSFSMSPTDILIPMGMFICLVLIFFHQLSKTALFPYRDARILDSIHLKN